MQNIGNNNSFCKKAQILIRNTKLTNNWKKSLRIPRFTAEWSNLGSKTRLLQQKTLRTDRSIWIFCIEIPYVELTLI